METCWTKVPYFITSSCLGALYHATLMMMMMVEPEVNKNIILQKLHSLRLSLGSGAATSLMINSLLLLL